MFVFFFKQKTAYEMRISDWSSDVCSADLNGDSHRRNAANRPRPHRAPKSILWPKGAANRMTEDTASAASPQSLAILHPQQQEMPLAVVHGQAVLQIPQDLYIPPDALE